MKSKANNDIICSVEATLFDTYKATYKSKKSNVIVKDTVKFQLPNGKIIKLFFRNGKLIKGESKDLTQDEIDKVVQQLKDLYN